VTLPVLFAEPGLFRFPLFRFEQQRHRGIGRDRLLASCQKSIGEKRVAAPTIIIIAATTIITGAITVVTDESGWGIRPIRRNRACESQRKSVAPKI
jgi:hypothetical protein